MKGGARSTAEAVSGLVLHPSDSITDFKALFNDLAQIWNNGKIGEGLRSHGIPAVNLIIKYLPLAGPSGVAAAAALEKLQVAKWINVFASLIDFVSGDGNIMTFLNALKELVGDLFKQLGDVLLDAAKHPEKIGNAIKGGLEAIGNEVQNAFDPGRAQQQAEYNINQEKIAGENGAVDQLASMALEDAKAKFDENPPESFEQAVDWLSSFAEGARVSPNRQPEKTLEGLTSPLPANEILDGIDEFKEAAKDASGHSKGPSFDIALGRAQATLKLYAIPYWIYLRDNYDSRPDVYKSGPLPTIPQWSEQEFVTKMLKSGEPFFGTGPRPVDEYDDFARKFIDATEKLNPKEARRQARLKEIDEASFKQRDEELAGYQAAADKLNDYTAGAPERIEAGKKILAADSGQAFSENIAMTTDDDVFINAITYPIYDSSGNPHIATPSELDGFLAKAKASHKSMANYINNLLSYITNASSNASWSESWKPYVAANANFLLKSTEGKAALKEILDKNGMTSTWGRPLTDAQKKAIQEMLAITPASVASAIPAAVQFHAPTFSLPALGAGKPRSKRSRSHSDLDKDFFE